MTITGNL